MKYTKAWIFVLVLCFFSFRGGQGICTEGTTYQFYGRHLMAQYYDCDPTALGNPKRIGEVMTAAAVASGAHIIKSMDYIFEPNGYSMILLLSESHASIHTYPEHNACFIDYFTCGHHSSPEKFDALMRAYLLPKKWKSAVQERE